jgi:hypothetical protein
MTSTTTKEDSPGDRILEQIMYRLKLSRNKAEQNILKDILLRSGISEISNSKDKEYFFNQIRTQSLIRDQMEGKITITIDQNTHNRLVDLNMHGQTYDIIITKLIDSYEREKDIGPKTNPLERIVSNEETEQEE